MGIRKVTYFLLSFFLVLMCGCKSESEIKKVKDIEFTVVAEADLPQELLDAIKEKKQSPFSMTFKDGEYLYIARGYGEQKSGGYGIEVKELFLGENAIYFKTELIGPSQQDLVAQICTYPYVVVKIELTESPVVFD